MKPYLESDAVISDCGTYRYMLRRTWDHNLMRALIVMLNPSTADAKEDDQTIRSCVRLLKALNFGSMEIVNLFAYRSSDPEKLSSYFTFDGRNDLIIESSRNRCDITICAWGAYPWYFVRCRAIEVCGIVRSERPSLFCFGTTKSGAPKHPLYLKTGTQLTHFGGVK